MKPSITVVPLGPGDPSLMTMQTADLLQSGRYRVILRTARHPAASWMEKQGISFEIGRAHV